MLVRLIDAICIPALAQSGYPADLLLIACRMAPEEIKKPFRFERVMTSNLKGMVSHSVFRKLAVQGGKCYIQQPCGFCFVAVGIVQHFADMNFFGTGQVKG